jgi:hypothetical protein
VKLMGVGRKGAQTWFELRGVDILSIFSPFNGFLYAVDFSLSLMNSILYNTRYLISDV